MEIQIAKISFFTTQKLFFEDLQEIRGFFGSLFETENLFHQHDSNKLLYRYPLIQYKILNNKLMIMGFNEAVPLLITKLENVKKIQLADREIELVSKKLHLSTHYVRLSKKFQLYHFVTPYFALNEENYQIFKNLEQTIDKKALLEKILIGNILSFLKNMNIWLKEKITIDLFVEKIKIIEFKDQQFTGFSCEFATNIILPDFMGLGKSVSRGFGVIHNSKNIEPRES
jgi:hypothetical protein